VKVRLLLIGLGRRILDSDAEHLTEILAEAVGGTTLNTTAGSRYISFDGSGVETPSELLLFSLLTLYNRDGQELLVDLRIVVENLQNLLMSALLSKMCGVALLPKEFTGTKERLGVLELPSNDGVPLVELEGQVSVATDPLGVVRVHDSLGRGTDGNLLLERGGTTTDRRSISIETPRAR
jgi:hypothetical protein